MMVPRCVGPIIHPGEKGCILDDLRYAKSVATRKVKVTLPAPLTVTSVSKNEYYATERERAMAWAAAINKEAHLLADAGADVVQFDDPGASRFPEKFKEWGVEALDRCCEGLEGKCQTA